MSSEVHGVAETFSVRDERRPAESPRRTRTRARSIGHAVLDLVALLGIIVFVTTVLWGADHLTTSDSVRQGVPIAIAIVGWLGWEGLYDRAHNRRWPATTALVTQAVFVSATAFALAGFVVAIGEGARRWVVVVCALWWAFLVLHHGLRAMRRVYPNRVIVAGQAREAVAMRTALRQDRSHKHEVVGFVLDRLDADVPPIVADMALGSLDDLPHLSDRYEIDQVLFCMSGLRGDKFAPLSRDLNRRGLDVILTDLGEIAPRRVRVGHVEGRPTITIRPAVRSGWRILIKRAVDVVVASAILLVLSPLLGAVALAIRVSDGESPIFAQQRVGKGGRLFTIYKFRTMITDAEALKIDLTNDHEGPVFKMTGDPRITRIGGFLRKTSIDEFPQLWNVIKGDMSLVGPRPLLESEVLAAPPSFRDRELVTPGMTGHWQVSGRSDTDFDQLDELDRWYVDNWSLGKDLEILAKTVPAVLLQRGAR